MKRQPVNLRCNFGCLFRLGIPVRLRRGGCQKINDRKSVQVQAAIKPTIVTGSSVRSSVSPRVRLRLSCRRIRRFQFCLSSV